MSYDKTIWKSKDIITREKMQKIEDQLEVLSEQGTSGSGSGTSDYLELENKPQINGVTLTGNKSLTDLGAAAASDVAAKYTKPRTGIPASDLSNAVQASLNKADTALQGENLTSVVNNYIETNFSNPSSPPLDRTLSSSASAAPADMVGELKSALTNKVDSSMMQKCEVVEVEASANLWNKDDVSVGLLYKNGTVYTGGNYDNYRYNNQKISVSEGDALSFYYENSGIKIRSIQYVACYDANGTINANAGISNVSIETFTVPENVASVVLSIAKTWTNFMVLKNATQAPTEYIPYQEENKYYVATDDFVPDSIINSKIINKVDKNGTNQVTIKNCQFMVHSPNLFDKTELTVGVLNVSTGEVASRYTDYSVSDWIEVDPSTYYTLSCIRTLQVNLRPCWYKEDKTFIRGEEANANPTLTKQSPANAKFIRFSVKNTVLDYDIQLEKGETATNYMAYGSGYLKPENMPVINEKFVLNLPSKVYALVGTEMNIYFDNLVEGHDTDYEWDVTCSTNSIGMHLERGYRITASETGTYTLTFTVKRKSDGSTVTKSASLVITGANAGSGGSASVIVLGDSTTANGIVIGKLHDNFAEDSMSITTLGTCGTSPNNHEGRSGWRFSFYCTDASKSGVSNPFYNPTSETFDANYYFTNSGISKPDYFIINLGINDLFGASSDWQMNNAIEETISYCDTIIESLLDATTTTKVCVCFTIPPNYSQDAFGREYKTGQNRNRYKKNNVHWVQRLMDEYEGRENERIYVIPINISLDTRYNMGFDTQPVNARNTDITYQMPIGNGGIHPVTSGYWQIADVYTAFLKGNAE